MIDVTKHITDVARGANAATTSSVASPPAKISCTPSRTSDSLLLQGVHPQVQGTNAMAVRAPRRSSELSVIRNYSDRAVVRRRLHLDGEYNEVLAFLPSSKLDSSITLLYSEDEARGKMVVANQHSDTYQVNDQETLSFR